MASRITRNIGKGISPDGIVPQIELFGDWARTQAMLSTIDGVLAVAMEKGRKSVAEKLKAAIRKNIRENGGSLRWSSVSTKYAKFKRRKGYDPNNLLQMTNLYYNSINVWKAGLNYYVGVKRNVKHNEGRLTVGQIANILEHGSVTRGIAPRPLWGPTYKQIGGKTRVKGVILWHIRNEIYKSYGIRPKLTL